MDEKIRNTVIIFIAVIVFMFISVAFLGTKTEKQKALEIKKEQSRQASQPHIPPASDQNTAEQNATSSARNNAISGRDSVATDNYSNLTLSYFYYIPQSVLQTKGQRHPYLILVPGLGEDGQGFVTQVFTNFADTYGFVIIAPSFMLDDKNVQSKTSYQYPQAWSGKALNDIFNSFDSKQGMMPSRLYMLGVSAGAQFVLRYSLLYPDYVTACAVNATEEFDNPTKYQATKFYIAVYAHDEVNRKQIAQNFYNLALQQKIDATYKEYPNVVNQVSADEINDELAFFGRINSMADR